MAFEALRNADLRPVQSQGWRSGLANLWQKESRRWWQNWLWQALIWIPLLDGFTLIAGVAARMSAERGAQTTPSLLVLVLLFFTVFPAFGTVIMAHGKILDEQQSGTASWVLSKPVTRTAFLLAKLASLPGMLLLMVLVPGVIAYPLIWLFQGQGPDPVIFGLMLGLNASTICFFFCLMLLLGGLWKKRGAVLGVGGFVCFVMLQALFQNNVLANLLVTRGWLLAAAIGLLLALALLSFLLALARFVREEF